MIAYIARRVALTIPVMAIVAFVVFGLLYLTPGDPAVVIAGDQASPDDVARIRASLGLDRPFLVQFGVWLWHLAQGDLGLSISSALPVTAMIGQRILPTIWLLVASLAIAILIAVPLGVVATWRRGSVIDRMLTVGTVLGFSVPVFVVGYALAYAFASTLRWLPVQGYTPPSEDFGSFASHIALPAITLGIAYAALIARVTRAAMLDVLKQDYIRTARAKGLAAPLVLFRHALKNAAVPIVTVIGLGIATLIGGSVVTESVFVIPGLGRLTVDAILHRDYPIIQGVVLLFSLAHVLINLGVDLVYTIVDPRIRY